jgi:transcriptional regulator with XRE-family HTH domain
VAEYRTDPSALRFLIGHDLRTARERAGLKQVDAARVLGCSQARINYLESGRTQQQPDDVVELLRAFDVAQPHIDRLAGLAGRADQETWWAPFSGALPAWFQTFVGLEGLAATEFTYRSLRVPGQLQTPEYAAALLVGNLRVAPKDAPHVVRARMARQRLDHETHPLEFRAVVEEQVLDRLVGGVTTMLAQLRHMLTLADRGNVRIQVLPAEVAVHDGLDGDFIVLDFDEAESIGYIEYPAGSIYVQDQEQVDAYRLAAQRLEAMALPPAQSAEVIADRVEALRRRTRQ